MKISLHRHCTLLCHPLYFAIYNTLTSHGGKGITFFLNWQIKGKEMLEYVFSSYSSASTRTSIFSVFSVV